MIKNYLRYLKKIDWLLLAPVMLLTVLGIASLYTGALNVENPDWTLFNKQLIFFVIVPLFLLLINFVPLIGSLIYTILANLFVAWDMGFNYVSYPMSRKLIPFREQLRFGVKNKFRLIGFGIPLMIPFFNLLFAPLFVVGGTLLYLDTLKDQTS